MNRQVSRKRIRLLAALTILALCLNLLPPPLPVHALAPSLPDYSAQLMALSGTLERDEAGDLRFPYPVNEPVVAVEGVQAFQLPMGFGWLTRWLHALGWASAMPSLSAHASQSPARLRAPPPSQLAARQNANRIRPRITNASPAQAPLGETALFAALLPDPAVLAAELGFATAQIQHLQRVIEHERTAITALDVQANRILNNEQANLAEKRAALVAFDYNGQLQTILRTSQTELQDQLGLAHYEQLVAWFNGAWQTVTAQRTTARAAAATEPCPTFTVFATRSFHTDYSADLPDQYIKFANQGIQYAHGYTNTTVYSVSVQLNDQIIHNVVITDAGPHNEDDNYWNRADDPLHPRRLFTDLPQVLAGGYFHGAAPDDIALATARYFDEANDEQLHLLTSNATDGEEGPITRTLTMTAGVAPAAIASVDLNLDLRPDVALALNGENALAVYTQVTATLPITNPTGITETNTLTGPLLLPLPAAANALAVGDFNDDLCVDLAAVVPGNDTIHLLQSTMEGPVLRQTTLAYPTDGYDALAAGDLDNNGDDDIAALRGSGYITESIVVYLQEQGAYPVSTVLTPTTGGYLPHSLSVGDVNNDGRDDLVVTAGGNTPNSYLNVFLQGTAGLTTTVITHTAFHLPGAVAVADINHDGRNDVIVVNEAWRTLSLYSQTAAGKLAPYAVATLPYSSHYQPHGLSLADFDGNGGLDLALVGQEAGLTVITNSLSAPTSTILYPADAATLTPATVALPPRSSHHQRHRQQQCGYCRGAAARWHRVDYGHPRRQHLAGRSRITKRKSPLDHRSQGN